MVLEATIFMCGAICLIIGATGYALGYSAGVSYAIKRMDEQLKDEAIERNETDFNFS